MANVGRKAKITESVYLEAVRKLKTSSNIRIASYLGVNRSSISRFLEKYPDCVTKADEILKASTETIKMNNSISMDVFMKIPIIEEWIDIQNKRRVKKTTQQSRLSNIYNICQYLGVHPEDLDINRVCDLAVQMRDLQEMKQDVPSGLSYLTIRQGIRSFFQLVHGISGEMLSSKGVEAGRTKGTGKASTERITKEQRHRFEKTLINAIDYFDKKGILDNLNIDKNMLYYEMLGISQFMYYTASRIGSGGFSGCLSMIMNNPKHQTSDKIYYINYIDKGKRGGIEWNKMLIDDGLIRFKKYLINRFEHINEENINLAYPNTDSKLFPILSSNYDLERKIMKMALKLAGVHTGIPNHIWRHTFAQDFLEASDHNYELCASIGGWKDTGTLKLSYGGMSEGAKVRGLTKSMGLPVEDVTHQLRW